MSIEIPTRAVVECARRDHHPHGPHAAVVVAATVTCDLRGREHDPFPELAHRS